VFEGSSWLNWHGFPDGKLHGKPAVAEWLKENPDQLVVIRNEVLTRMAERKSIERTKLVAVDG
jgi:phenolic acid decarboxylase